MQTTYRKSATYGHMFETQAPLGGLIDRSDNTLYYLRVCTYKNVWGVIQSYASVISVGPTFERSVIGHNFSKWLNPSENISRSTYKSVKKIHDETLTQWASLYEQAHQHQKALKI